MIPSKIYNVRIYFLPEIKDALLKELHELGVFELKRSSIKELSTNLLDKEHAIFSRLEYDLQGVEDGGSLMELDELASKVPLIEEKTKKLKDLLLKRKQLNARKKELLNLIEDGELILTYLPYEKLPKSTKLQAFLIPKKNFSEKFLKLFEDAEVYDIGTKVLLVGISDKDVSISEGEKLYVPESKQEIEKAKEELTSLTQELQSLESQIESLKKDPLLKDAKTSIQVYLERENAKAYFARSKHFYVLEAYVPEKFLKKAIEHLKNKFKDKIHIEYSIAKDHPPTYIEVPKMVETYHKLGIQYGVPSYVDIDPSIFYWIFVPLMFGFIVGDAIYGLIILGLALWLERKAKDEQMKHYTKMWKLGAIFSILFGIAFNEFLGFPLDALLKPLGINVHFEAILHRAHDINTYLIVGLALGYVHLLLAYILGAIKYWFLKADLKHFLAKLGWLLLLLSIGTFFMFSGTIVTLPMLFGILGLILITYGEGLLGIIELPSLVSNLLSYLRLPILGLVSVILAELINSFLGGSLPSFIVGFIFVMVLHFLHALLLVLEGSIQAGRLNLVEFRSKFFTGGGRLFKPFMLNKEVIKNGRRNGR